MSYFKYTAHEILDLLNKKEVSSLEVAESVYKRIEDKDPKIQAYLALNKDKALAKAREIDDKRAKNLQVGKLAGIPMALKDNISTMDLTTTCSSKMLYNYKPPYDATTALKLAGDDAILLGKLNMDEFAMGSSTETSAYQQTKNPFDLSYVPGGSSGGAAAAVAADEAFFTLGSDTGGSIRQPASYCGVVGMKPTYGAVSRYGLIAFASSLDQIGPFTKDVTDCALVMNSITGHDANDSTSADIKYPDYTKALVNDIKGMKIGIPKEYFGEGISAGVRANIDEAIKKLEELGAEIGECSMPNTEYAMPAYYIIAPAECSSNLSRYDGVRYGLRSEQEDTLMEMFCKTRNQGFGSEVKSRIMLGTYALSAGYYDAYYLKALRVRNLIKQDFDKAFEKFDILLTPTVPSTAFKFGEISDPISMYLQDVCTIPVNLAGLPGLSMPYGTSEGMPVGIQFIGKPFGEETILRAAYTLEQNSDKTILKAGFKGE
ncbi:MAG: Asp-tRNA(Asn)/Glu-tRNA(Gln) amidotransferase subunit GatA [Clostridia bacterium]|nr:Asp-tRNA(Asn)/Glu-tRNA(Gln) amidotransferase subunit GatA [Clostridia bacterium]